MTSNTSSADYYKNRKAEVLNELYRKDGDEMMENDKYRAAIELYAMALRIEPTDLKALVNRSKCHLKLLHIRKATDDVDNALHLNNLDKEALLQKAEVLFKTQNYESALVYYNRGMKHYPRNAAFLEGAKCTEQLLRGKRSKTKRMKLSTAGDLSYLNRKNPPPKPFVFENKSKGSVKLLPKPSASFRDRPLCQLIRIHKSGPVSLSGSTSMMSIPKSPVSDDSFTEERRPESTMMKSTLKELYKDKKYLQRLTASFQIPAGGSPVQEAAEEGLNFLYNRYSYWNRLGPLPPPHAPRKSRNKFSGSTMSIDSTGTFKSHDSKSTVRSHDSGMSWKTKGSVKSKLGLGLLANRKTKKDPSKIEFKFTSHWQNMDFGSRNMTEIAEENEDADDNENENGNQTADERTLSDYISGQLMNIDSLYRQKQFTDVYDKCDQLLRLLDKYQEANEPRKPEFTAVLNSYMGNVAQQSGNVTLAMKHHTTDLRIGEKYDIGKSRSRALGNLGRTYMIQKKYNKALEMYTMKAPLCKTAAESSSLFHDIGNCFLMLTSFSYARDAGRKSLETAEEADDKSLQLHASILIGLSEVNMKKYQDAHTSFETALSLAESLGDEKVIRTMEQALVDVNRKLARKHKKIHTYIPMAPALSHRSGSDRSLLVE